MPLPSDPPATTTPAAFKTWAQNTKDTVVDHDGRISDLEADTADVVLNTDTSTVDMDFVVDEDDMASDSATKVPTQQSVKAYVDTEVAGVGGGGGAGVEIRRAVYSGGGVITTTSTTRTPIDSTNLPYKTFTLAIGDYVECELSCGARNQTAAQLTCFDFEVDQPTSANLYIGAGLDSGIVAAYNSATADFMESIKCTGTFVATEAGVHQFRPVWFVTGGTGALFTAASSSYDQLATFVVRHYPASVLT